MRAHALALYRAGRQVEALGALRALGAGLAELGLEPSAATRELERGILVHEPGLAGERRSAARRLPARASRFFGREEQLARAEELLRDSRLLTVAGVGGAGKTRLALEVADRVDFPEGPWWCELGPVGADADVAGAVADALALEGGLEQLTPRTGLLLLDNCEHVLDGSAAVVEEVLARCPDLRILVTSRAPLGVDGEQVMRLLGLAGDDATALFRDRAAAAGADAADPAVVELCRRLDGLPLAIELAAGRTRSLAPSEIVERLDERFDVLAVWGRRSAPRHWTLRAAIAWSYELLEEPQRRLFERLSVFARGCSLAEAEAVCAGDGVERVHVAGLLDELVAHSLLVTRAWPAGAPRTRCSRRCATTRPSSSSSAASATPCASAMPPTTSPRRASWSTPAGASTGCRSSTPSTSCAPPRAGACATTRTRAAPSRWPRCCGGRRSRATARRSPGCWTRS